LQGEESAALQLELPVRPNAEGFPPSWEYEPEKPFGEGANGSRGTAPRQPEHATPPQPALQFGHCMRVFELHATDLPPAPPLPATTTTGASDDGDGARGRTPQVHEVALPGGPLVVGDWLKLRLGCPRGSGHWSVAAHDTALRQQAPLHWLPHGCGKGQQQLVRFVAHAPSSLPVSSEGGAAAAGATSVSRSGVELLMHERGGSVKRVRVRLRVVKADRSNCADARFDPLKAAAAAAAAAERQSPMQSREERAQLQQLWSLLQQLKSRQSLETLARLAAAL
jgi:hypothetical protein